MAQVLLQFLQQSVPLGEKLKKINEFANKLSDSEVDEILKVLKTDPDTNEVRLKLADVFKRSPTVLEFLEHGDKLSIRRAATFRWMYGKGSELTSSAFLIKDFFPRVAFTTRQKIINQISLHLEEPSVADNIFHAVKTKYGIPMAKPLLAVCSEEVITKQIIDDKADLSSAQLLAITKRFPQLGIKYLKKYNEEQPYGTSTYSGSVKYLLDHYPDDAIKLLQDENNKSSQLSLGHKRSKRILKTYPAVSVDIVGTNTSFFQMDHVRKHLTAEQYQAAFQKAVPNIAETLSSVWSLDQIWTWIEHLPKNRRLELIETAFKAQTKKDLMDSPEHIGPFVFNLLPADQRAKVIDWKLANCSSNDYIYFRLENESYETFQNSKWVWTAMRPTSVSIPELTKLLQAEKDVRSRTELYTLLVLTCVVNKDADSLTKNLQLLTRKCRNDQPEIRKTLLDAMRLADKNFELKEADWACFQEVLQFLQLYKEARDSEPMMQLLPKFIMFRQKNNLPVETEILAFVKNHDKQAFIDNFQLPKDPQLGKQLLEAYLKALEGEIGSQDLTAEQMDVFDKIVTTIEDSPKLGGKISDYPWLKARCLEIMDTRDPPTKRYHDKSGGVLIRQKICNALLKEGISEDLDKVFGSSVVPGSALLKCLQKYPEKINDNLQKISVTVINETKLYLFKPYYNFLFRLKKALPAAAKDFKEECYRMLKHEFPETVAEEMANAVKLLSVLESSSEFLALAQKHVPKESKIDTSEPIDEVDYALKSAFAGSLKNVADRHGLLSAIEKFCTGDYLKLAVGSLYSACVSLPESEILPRLKGQLKDRPVSAKKHMIRLFFMISPLEEKSNILKDMWESEKNATIRHEILVQMYQLFKNNPSKEVWELLKSAIESLKEDDSPSLDHIKENSSIDSLLKEFTTEFFEVILSTLKRVDKEVNPVFERITSSISNVTNEFLNSLLLEIVRDISSLSSSSTTASQLIQAYVLDASVNEEIRDKRLDLVQGVIQELFENHWDVTKATYSYSTQIVYPARELTTEVFKGLCRESKTKDEEVAVQKKVLQYFLEQLEKVPDLSRTFTNVFYIKFTLLGLEKSEGTKAERARKLGGETASLVKLYVDLHGADIVPIIYKVVRDAWNYITSFIRDDILYFIDGLLQAGETRANLILSINLMPDTASGEELEVFERVGKLLKGSQDAVVRIYYDIKICGRDSVFND